jgi:hypothetical protein
LQLHVLILAVFTDEHCYLLRENMSKKGKNAYM